MANKDLNIGSIGKRIKAETKRNELSYREIATHLGVTEQTVRNYASDRTDIPNDKIIALAKFLSVSPVWLITGEETQRHKELTGAAEPLTTYRKAQAGRSVASNHRVHLRNLLAAIVDDLPEAVYEIFEVEGASMETTLSQGDKLLCRSDSVDNIQDNRIYVLVTDDPTIKEYRESGVWIKRCSLRKENGYISCRSDNKDTTEPYNTFRLKSNTVKEVWYPVMKITHHMSDPNRDIYDRLDELESRIEMLEEDNE